MKREKLVNQYYELRKELKAKGDYEALRKLPRDSSPTRLTRRCKVTGRPRGVLRKFEMSRIAFREHAHKGQLYLKNCKVYKDINNKSEKKVISRSRLRYK